VRLSLRESTRPRHHVRSSAVARRRITRVVRRSVHGRNPQSPITPRPRDATVRVQRLSRTHDARVACSPKQRRRGIRVEQNERPVCAAVDSRPHDRAPAAPMSGTNTRARASCPRAYRRYRPHRRSETRKTDCPRRHHQRTTANDPTAPRNRIHSNPCTSSRRSPAGLAASLLHRRQRHRRLRASCRAARLDRLVRPRRKPRRAAPRSWPRSRLIFVGRALRAEHGRKTSYDRRAICPHAARCVIRLIT